MVARDEARDGAGSMSLPYRFTCVAVALVALLATSFCFHALLPPAIPEGVATKLRFFTEHRDEFDTLFVGTSRFYYAVSPEIFDTVNRANGLPTRTFNFGVDGMHPPEMFYVLEQILKTKPRNLKWVFLEFEDIQTHWSPDVRGTRRILYWHDWPRTVLALKKALNPRGGARWYGKLARLLLARKDLALNVALFGKNFANVGRGADFFAAPDPQQAAKSRLELGRNRDGYRSAGVAMSTERAASFQQKLAQELAASGVKWIDPYAESAYRAYAARIRQFGAKSFFVVTPVIWQSSWRFREAPPPGPLLLFNDYQTYPRLYDTTLRIDEEHLTRLGAEEFTRLLAQEFARLNRQP